MDANRDNLIGQFREEVDTYLLRLQQGIVVLEQEPDNRAVLGEVFRAAHTIKGSARLMGFADISRVTHALESVLSEMRDGHSRLTPEISDVLFDAIDVVTALTQVAVHPGAAAPPSPADLDGLITRLHALLPPTDDDLVPPSDLPTNNGHTPYEEGLIGAVNPPPAPSFGQFRDDTVRVQVQKLDTLMNLAGEMIVSKMQNEELVERLHRLVSLSQAQGHALSVLSENVRGQWGILSQHDLETALGRLRGLETDLDGLAASTLRDFQDYSVRMSNVADELEDTVLSVRMLPIESLFEIFPRRMRDIARESGKQIELMTRGGETELDKQILEGLHDPLTHLLRNAVSHGIELPAARQAAGKPALGRVMLRAFQQGSQVAIEVSDDGGGIDPQVLRRVAVQKGFLREDEAAKLSDDEMLQWIYRPGFTTASIITDDAGRGVGMDIVKTTLERMNGTVQVQSYLGQGTTVSLKVPLTLATTQGLLVRVAGQVFVLPSHTVETMEYLGADNLFSVEGREVVRVRDRTVPVVRLEELLDLERLGPFHHQATTGEMLGGITLPDRLPGIVVGEPDRQMCFLVDELLDERVIVVKSLGPLFAGVDSQAGATLLGNGQVVIILDVPSLMTEARTRSTQGQLARAWRETGPSHVHRILVVDDSITTRELEKGILENAGYEVEVAMDGQQGLLRLERDPGHFDIAIVDIEMPHMDGLDLTQRIKTHRDERLRQLPVIIVSSLASDAYKRRGIEVGAQAYITKGQFEQNRLLETIELLIH